MDIGAAIAEFATLLDVASGALNKLCDHAGGELPLATTDELRDIAQRLREIAGESTRR